MSGPLPIGQEERVGWAPYLYGQGPGVGWGGYPTWPGVAGSITFPRTSYVVGNYVS